MTCIIIFSKTILVSILLILHLLQHSILALWTQFFLIYLKTLTVNLNFFPLFFGSLSFPLSLEFISDFHLEDFTYLSDDP